MKRVIALFMFFILLLTFTACSPKEETIMSSTIAELQESTDGNTDETADSTIPEEQSSENGNTTANSTTKPADQDKPSGGLQDHSSLPQQPQSETASNPTPSETVSDTPVREPESSSEPVAQQPEEPKEEEPLKQEQFYIIAGETTFTAHFADNSSADAFRELLSQGNLTINMSDYGSFEKVGSIGQSLPREDSQISTTTGDVILYQGSQIVIFYGTNSWRYSRLGKIQNATRDDLLTAFGRGDVTITFSLTK